MNKNIIPPVIQIDHVTFSFGSQPVLEDITFNIEPKDFIAFIGPNGAGKTTLVKLLMGFLEPDKGTIRVLGSNPKVARTHLGYVPQYTTFDLDYPLNVLDTVKINMINSGSLMPWFGKNEAKKAYELLEKMEIESLAHRKFSELSGGQKQRALIARALASEPEILILDEPTASIDITIEKNIYDLLKKLNENITIILVSHDISFISSYINKICCLNRFATIHSIDELTGESLFDVYDRNIKYLKHHCHL